MDLVLRFRNCIKDTNSVSDIVNAIEFIDRKDKVRSFTVGVCQPGDLMVIKPGDHHVVITCHLHGYPERWSMALGRQVYIADHFKLNYM